MARTNLQIKVGTYTGNATDNRHFTDVGFAPDFVMIKGGSNATVFRVKQLAGDATMHASVATANFANGIQGLTSTGFVLGTNAVVNGSGVTYHYIAIRGAAGQDYFRTGKYIGDGVNDRDFTGGGLGFTPDIVIVKGSGATDPVFRTSSHTGDDTSGFSAINNAANVIQNLQANGFQLGDDADVNTSGTDYYFATFKTLPGVIATGTYTGNGADDRSITGVGFQPDVVFIKRNGGITCRLKTSTLTGDDTFHMGSAASNTNEIQAFESDGFQVGSSANVNLNAAAMYWIALKGGDFNVPINRTAI